MRIASGAKLQRLATRFLKPFKKYMSHISNGDQLTSREVNLIAALDALPSDGTKAIAKSGSTSFTQISTGGGSGGMEIPGGTVNGANTSFTVNNLPVWIEVSGQTMVSSTTDVTNYGYTLSGTGPYTITFLSAPAAGQTPHSFHN